VTLLWTINDFPELGNMFGWNMYTGLACPTCNFETDSCWLYKGKFCFMGHHQFLNKEHIFILNCHIFNGTIELRDAPEPLSKLDIFKQVEGVNVTFGKPLDPIDTSKRAQGKNVVDIVRPEQWRKRSIFFGLSYWKTNLLRHCLNMTHI